MDELNLPKYDVKIRTIGGRRCIHDILRDKYVALTPEEWVRQHFIHYLIDDLGYSRYLMGNEVALSLNGMSRRCDTVVYDRQLCPRMIIEYKAPSVAITQCVFDQISRYNLVMHVDFLVVSNGLSHYCCQLDYDRQNYCFLEAIPHGELLR